MNPPQGPVEGVDTLHKLACLLQHPDILLAAVIGIPDNKWGQKIIAHLVVSDPNLNAEAILEFCLMNERLPNTHLPKQFYFHDK